MWQYIIKTLDTTGSLREGRRFNPSMGSIFYQGRGAAALITHLGIHTPYVVVRLVSLRNLSHSLSLQISNISQTPMKALFVNGDQSAA